MEAGAGVHHLEAEGAEVVQGTSRACRPVQAVEVEVVEEEEAEVVEVEVEEHQTHQAVEEAVEVGEALVPPVQAS